MGHEVTIVQPAEGTRVEERETRRSEGHEHPACTETVSLLNEYVDGAELDDQTRERVAQHVRACPPCHHVLDKFHLALSPWRS